MSLFDELYGDVSSASSASSDSEDEDVSTRAVLGKASKPVVQRDPCPAAKAASTTKPNKLPPSTPAPAPAPAPSPAPIAAPAPAPAPSPTSAPAPPAPATTSTPTTSSASPAPAVEPAKRRFVGRRRAPGGASSSGKKKKAGPRRIRGRRTVNRVPAAIRDDPALARAMAALPSNYEFEIPKIIWKVREAKARRVALQFPEGLLLFACVIADIVEHFCAAEAIVMGDVTYGACCVDDLTAGALGCDFLVHFGHSCLVPIDVTNGSTMKVMYVFVGIGIDVPHLTATIKRNLPEASTRLVLMGVIQFSAALHATRKALGKHFTAKVQIPQAKPLSGGEVLGCTSPVLEDCDAMVFVADGRFHLESALIHNPGIRAYRYNPYSKVLSEEGYDIPRMKALRKAAIDKASSAGRVGIVLGTLGRQGNPGILKRLTALLDAAGKEYFVVLLSEIFPDKLALFRGVDAWVQIACPRLSIDWGHHFKAPLLSPYEATVAFKAVPWCGDGRYPMDFYSKSAGMHGNYYTGPGEDKGANEVVIHARRK